MKIVKRIKYGIFNFLRFVPDGMMLRLQYGVKLRRWLHLRHPRRFTEWIQWYKACYRNNEMLQCTDKYQVRNFVEERLGGVYLNNLYQVCDNAFDIDFTKFPNRFVIKTTDGGNGDNVFICKDKSSLDVEHVIKLVNSWRHKHYENISREWAYTGAQKSRIIVEEFLEDSNCADGSIDDYKFLCFNGKCEYFWIDKDRFTNHRRAIYDKHLHYLPGVGTDYPISNSEYILPDNIEVMIQLSEKLASSFPFVRVDWYNINGRIIFGELTFYPSSGYCPCTPDAFDFELGECFSEAVNGSKLKR